MLYALGEDRRIVGISGFTVRPPRARKEKPKVSAFINAKIGEILKLEPDLAIGFSDIQADIARELIKSGVEVWISNHRSVDGILAYIRRLGAMVGAHEKAEAYAQRAEQHIADIRAAVARLPRRPRVYFEEWDEPIITGIRWVAEIIGIAGGDDSLSRAGPRAAGEAAHPAEWRRSGAACAGHHSWLMVRQALPARTGGSAAGLGHDSGGAQWRPARDQVADHPAAGTRHALFDGLDAIHRIIVEWALR